MTTSASVSKSKPVVIPFTDQELELMGINVQQARESFENVQDFGDFQDRLFSTVSPILEQLGFSQTQDLQAKNTFSSDQGFQDRALERDRGAFLSDLTSRLSQTLNGEGGISDSDRALLDTLEGNAISGVRDSTGANLQLVRDTLAPSLGFRGSDSPIIDRGGLIAQEGIRREADIRAARAAQELALPGQRLGELTAAGGAVDAASQFQKTLRQGDFQNQLAFLGQAQNSGLGLANVKADSGLQAAIKPIVANKTKSVQASAGL